MKNILLAGVASLFSLAAAQAAPITGGTVLTSGNLTFSNFTCSDGPLGTAGGGCAGLSVDAFAGAGIQISGGLSAFTGPNGTASTQDILVSFQVASTGVAMTSIGLGYNGSFEGNSFSEVRETVYADAARTQLLDTGLVRVSALSQTFNNTLSFSPVFTAYVVKDILLQSFAPGGLATISSVTQVGTPGTPVVPVPEPASLALFGMGLLGMGLVRRRKASQQG